MLTKPCFPTLKLCSRHCREYRHKMAVLIDIATFSHPSDFSLSKHYKQYRHKMAVLVATFSHPSDFFSLKALQTVQTQNGSAHSHVFTTFKLFLSQSTVDSIETKMAVLKAMFVSPSDFVSQGIKESTDTKWQRSVIFFSPSNFFIFL